VSPTLTNRFVAFGLMGAVVVTIVGAVISPDHSLTAISVFARATAYILVVFSTAAIATYVGLVTREGRSIRAREIAVRTAATALWLPPLLLFSAQRSWFGCVIWAALLVEGARLTAFLRGIPRGNDIELPQAPPEGPFSVLKRDFPFGTSIVGVLMIQGAIFSAVDGHDILAGLLYFAGTAAIAYRSLQMFQDLSALDNRDLRQQILAGLLSATFLIVFAWLPYIAGLGGTGTGGDSTASAGSARRSTPASQTNGVSARKNEGEHSAQGSPGALARLRTLFAADNLKAHGNSFASAKRILDSTFPQESDGKSTHLRSRQETKIAAAVDVVGPVFPGIKLYPEAEPHTRLVAPPLGGNKSFGVARSDPVSIPFDGVYWFWRGPSDRPPSNSIVMHGSPSARFFRSTDGGMSMEARQNLGFMVDPKRYGAIELFIENADPFPNTVSILLKIRDTTVPGKTLLSLGMEGVSTPASPGGSGVGRTQMLRFRIPSAIAIGSFDELTVSYYLKGARSDRSARIAIERFRLVPRGG
jgi:hypothetical protein